MKVKVTVTVDIDVAAWTEAYGIDRTEVPQDVRAYIANGATEHLRDLGLLRSVG